MAPAAARLPALEDHPPLLQDLEARRYLGEDARRPTQARAGAHEPRSRAERGGGGQSVKTTGVGGGGRGYDGAKKVKGRKRHLLVDTQGLVLEARVHSASIQDRDGIKLLLEPARTALTRLSHLWMDAGYTPAKTRA
jgi:DDE family transposase